jgi:hypothetical protein
MCTILGWRVLGLGSLWRELCPRGAEPSQACLHPMLDGCSTQLNTIWTVRTVKRLLVDGTLFGLLNTLWPLISIPTCKIIMGFLLYSLFMEPFHSPSGIARRPWFRQILVTNL